MSGAASFRDPGGYVSVSRDRVIRTVLPEGLGNLNACLNSPAARGFVERGALIATHPLTADSTATSAETLVEHPRIPFASYPHEWPCAMLHAAGQLTLELCSALLEEGRGLEDATPANILFRGPRPVFIDVLSFEERDPLDPIWLADAQFARTFLIPLLLYRRAGYPVHQLFLAQRDGIAPEDAVRRLPGLRRWFPPDLGLVTLPAKAARVESDGLYRARRTRDAGEAQFILGHRFRALRKKLDRLAPVATAAPPAKRNASEGDPVAAKRQFVERTLREITPSRVLDAGSGAGEFSLMAAAGGASVVSIDGDAEAIAALWRSAAAAGADILPLVVDLARPTPAAGWRVREQAGFLERAEGFFDCVLLLDANHHLMITEQIPLAQIFDAMAPLTTRWLIVEYLAPQDALFRRLARGRDALYQAYGLPVFEACAQRSFDIVNSCGLPPSDGALYLLRRRS